MLNKFLNALAYNPPGNGEGYLFYRAWLNHIAIGLLHAGREGPIRRGVILTDCVDLAVSTASAETRT